MRTLITGINGFVGLYLCLELLRRGDAVSGADRRGRLELDNRRGIPGLAAANLANVNVRSVELTDRDAVRRAIIEEKPDRIVHLAGLAFVPDSWKSPIEALRSNALTTATLLEVARETGWKGRFLFASTSDVYGAAGPEELPLREDAPLRPESPYAATKVAAEALAQFFLRDGIEVIVARPFNHLGPGQRADFVAPAFLARIADAIAAGVPTIRVGELGAVRDFTDVRDVVRAYALLLERGKPGEIYNICSASPAAIREVLELSLAVAGARITYETDPDLLRPGMANVRYGDNTKIRSLGWKPEISLRQTIQDMWDYCQNTRTESSE
jgi:GDP-4-dehydro-6-deoxy-D-mannose reductase